MNTPDNSPDDQPVANNGHCDTIALLKEFGEIDNVYGQSWYRADVYRMLEEIKHLRENTSPVNQPDTLEEMVARIPEGWNWDLRTWRRGYHAEVVSADYSRNYRGTGPTPRAALASALAKIGEVG